jgi:hypothetical protein
MNFWLKGNVTIPARPHTVGGLIGWARGVNRALTELRDRKIEGKVTKGASSMPTPYPFQITVSADLLKSAPGLLGQIEIDSQEVENPTDGVWSLLAKIIINSTTGEITSSTVEWVTTVPTDTTTNYHLTIANLEILDGQIYTEINGPRQFTYGPISVVVGGGRDSKWMVRML